MKEVVLKFNCQNNFDQSGIRLDDSSTINNVEWLLSCAMEGISRSYIEGSPKHNEMKKLYTNLKKQLNSQISKNKIISSSSKSHYSIDEIKDILIKYPNDMELGAFIRNNI